jgi:hypothetical protein
VAFSGYKSREKKAEPREGENREAERAVQESLNRGKKRAEKLEHEGSTGGRRRKRGGKTGEKTRGKCDHCLSHLQHRRERQTDARRRLSQRNPAQEYPKSRGN